MVKPALNVLVFTNRIPFAGELSEVAPVIFQVNDLTPQLSLYEGAGMVMFFVQAVPMVFVVILAGQVIDGAMLSDKFTVNEEVAVLLAASVSV